MNLPQSQTNSWRAVVRVLRSPVPAQNLLHSITSVLFPADCRVCGDPLCSYSRVPVCNGCWKNLPAQSGPACFRCGESLNVADFGEGSPSDPGTRCKACRVQPPAFVKAVACGPYSGAMRPLLHLLKYDGLRPIAGSIGETIANQLASHSDLPSNQLVIPVPLFAAREKQRGFNQAELLAVSTVSTLRKLKPEWRGQLAVRVLTRSRASQSQAGLSLSGRRRNLRGAFFVSHPESILGRDILLIDDIYTTGATARACSRVLRRAGAASVWVATAARAQRFDTLQRIQFQSNGRKDPDMSTDVAMWESTVHQAK